MSFSSRTRHGGAPDDLDSERERSGLPSGGAAGSDLIVIHGVVRPRRDDAMTPVLLRMPLTSGGRCILLLRPWVRFGHHENGQQKRARADSGKSEESHRVS